MLPSALWGASHPKELPQRRAALPLSGRDAGRSGRLGSVRLQFHFLPTPHAAADQLGGRGDGVGRMAGNRAVNFPPRPPIPAARPGPARPSHPSRSEGVGWRERETLNVATHPLRAEPRASRAEAEDGGLTDPAGRSPAEPEGEKGALLQTLRVCRATSWGRRCAGPRRQRPRPSRCDGSGGASRPPEPSPATLAGGPHSGAARARPGRSQHVAQPRSSQTQYALPPATRVTRRRTAVRWARGG